LVEWIFAFETRRTVSRSKIANVVDDIVKLLEYAKGFPQEHLMSAGQLLLNPHSTLLTSIGWPLVHFPWWPVGQYPPAQPFKKTRALHWTRRWRVTTGVNL